jgi:DNA-binding IclR family transcriptional regulator
MPAAAKAKPRTQAEKVARGQPRYFSRAVAKALQILEMLQTSNEPLTLNDISKGIRLSKTSAFRLLCTLEGTGHLAALETGHYQQAPGIQSITPAQEVMKLLRVASPHLEGLNRQLGETVTLAALFENRVEAVAVMESQHMMRMANAVGQILPPYASSAGKVITAFQTFERREKLLRSFGHYRFTAATITDRAELQREFDRIREQGFAVDRGECVEEGICFAVPIAKPNGPVTSAVSTSIPKLRIRDAAQEKEIVGILRSAADALSRALWAS